MRPVSTAMHTCAYRCFSGRDDGLFGIGGVGASARLYLAPGRPGWNSPYTILEFYLTAFLLGSAGANVLTGASPLTQTAVIVAGIVSRCCRNVKFIWLARSGSMNGAASSSCSSRYSPTYLILRFLLLSAGLLLVPFAQSRWAALPVALLLIAGEFVSRYLFFVSVVPSNIATEYLSVEAA